LSSRPGARGVALVALPIRAYRLLHTGPPRCRFWPTCSTYALEALERHGMVRGGWLALRRVVRCRPGGGHGVDPVPLAPCELLTTSSGEAQ
jgi:putative membrane protein insertion efficiency factor